MKNSNKNFIKGLIFICSFFLVIVVQAQDVLISGKITDGESNNSLPGVNVIEKGTNNGTVSDIDGNYKISVSSGATLVYSFVGYATQEIGVSGRNVIDVALTTDITQLSEVVVVGYGEQEQKDLTGVVAKVSSEDFNNGAIVSPDNLIAGKIAGVQVVSNGGEPGAGVNIRVRGTSSIRASQEPLYVINGVPVDNAGFGSARNPLNFLNPSDIESFTVLKDASAAAIYGSRGTNGVILITTKVGKAGSKPRLTYNGWVSVANAIDKVDMLDGNEFRTIINDKSPGKSELLLNANTDWQAKILREAIGQNHEIGISGGGENLGYRFSVGHLEQEGIVKASETKKTTLSLSLNSSALDDHLTIGLTLNGAHTKDLFQDGGAIGSAIGYAPSQPVFDANSELGGYWEWPQSFGGAVAANPVSQIDQTIDKGDAYRSLGNLKLDYDVHYIDGLTATLIFGYDILEGERKRFQPTTLRSQVANGGTIFIERNTRTNQLFDAYLKYARDLESINSAFDILFGYEYQDRVSRFPKITGNQLSTNVFGFQSLSVASEIKPEIGVVPQRLRSYFGRLNYSFMDRYLLTVTVRNDGSSQFGPENQRGWFPSVGLGWRLTDEPFLNDIEVLTNLKLRVGYGTLGNQDFDAFIYESFYKPGGQFVRYQFGERFVNTIRPSARDEGIKWEETTQLNLGLDFEFFNGRLGGSLDYYKKSTSDLILNVPVPAGTNLSNFVVTNIGDMENEGVELNLNGVVLDGNDFNWNLGFNVALNKNKVTSLDGEGADIFIGGISGGVGSKIQIVRVGEPIGSFYTYTHLKGPDGKPLVDGVDHNEDGSINEADIYADNDGDGNVDLDDRVVSGNPAPDYILGLTSNMAYKNFDLSFTLRGAFGNEIYNNVASNNGNYNQVNLIVPLNMHRSVLDNNFFEPQILSDVYLEDGSFVKMDNISLGYTVPSLPGQMSVRVYATVQNAFSLTDYSGIDPETRIKFEESGIDNNLYPRSRTFLLGVSLGF